MKVSSPVGEFPFELERLRRNGTHLSLEGRMGAWPARVEVSPEDGVRLVRVRRDALHPDAGGGAARQRDPAASQKATGVSDESLAGRVAFVTGASSGIGAATAALLGDRGAAVALVARRRAELDRVLDGSHRAAVLPADVSDHDAVVRAIDRAEKALGPIDIAINCAGVIGPTPQRGSRRPYGSRRLPPISPAASMSDARSAFGCGSVVAAGS